MPSYRPVNSVTRALSLLEIMNRQQFSSLTHLHQLSGIPKPTIIRLLETLAAAGYVVKDASNKGYRITSAVNALSVGFHGAPLVVEAGRPWAQELTRQLKWPAAIAVLDENAMLVSYTTSAESPISPYHGILYRRLGILTRALGRAYLAYCPEDEREIILRMLRKKSHPDSNVRLRREAIDAWIAHIRRHGFAERDPQFELGQTSSVAVPIFDARGDRVLGSLGLTFYRSAVTRTRMVQVYVPAMKIAAQGISQSILALQNREQAGEAADTAAA